MVAFQKRTLALAKKHQTTDPELEEDDEKDPWAPGGAPQPAEPTWVPLALAQLGPGAVAQKLLADSKSTEEQIDAVALLALSMQQRFGSRPDKQCLLLPVATAVAP